MSTPEMAAIWVMALLCQHACQEVDHKEYPVALVASPNVLTIVAARSCAHTTPFSLVGKPQMGLLCIFFCYAHALHMCEHPARSPHSAAVLAVYPVTVCSVLPCLNTFILPNQAQLCISASSNN